MLMGQRGQVGDCWIVDMGKRSEKFVRLVNETWRLEFPRPNEGYQK